MNLYNHTHSYTKWWMMRRALCSHAATVRYSLLARSLPSLLIMLNSVSVSLYHHPSLCLPFAHPSFLLPSLLRNLLQSDTAPCLPNRGGFLPSLTSSASLSASLLSLLHFTSQHSLLFLSPSHRLSLLISSFLHWRSCQSSLPYFFPDRQLSMLCFKLHFSEQAWHIYMQFWTTYVKSRFLISNSVIISWQCDFITD